MLSARGVSTWALNSPPVVYTFRLYSSAWMEGGANVRHEDDGLSMRAMSAGGQYGGAGLCGMEGSQEAGGRQVVRQAVGRIEYRLIASAECGCIALSEYALHQSLCVLAGRSVEAAVSR